MRTEPSFAPSGLKMRWSMWSDRRHRVPLTFLSCACALVCFGESGVAQVRSSDGRWQVQVWLPDTFRVGTANEISFTVSDLAAQACPALEDVIVEMPQHGHGTDYQPRWTALPHCRWVVGAIEPTMRGFWRLRLVFNLSNATSVADL